MPNFTPQTSSSEDPNRIPWQDGYTPGSSGGMVCDVCRCLVRQDPASARIHREWHDRIGG